MSGLKRQGRGGTMRTRRKKRGVWREEEMAGEERRNIVRSNNRTQVRDDGSKKGETGLVEENRDGRDYEQYKR